MREVYLPYIFLTWLMMAVAAVHWLLQLVLFIYHDDHMANIALMVIETLFVVYLFAQHVVFLMRKESRQNNPHIQIGLLLIQCCLFILQMWWWLIFIGLLVNSGPLERLLKKWVIYTYHQSIKIKGVVNVYLQPKMKG